MLDATTSLTARAAFPAVVMPMVTLLDWLGAHGLDYDLHEHPLAETALETAEAEGIDPQRFVKVLGVARPDGRWILAALEASQHLDLVAAAAAVGCERVRLLTEGELAQVGGACEVGALPPIGDLFGVPIYADERLREHERLTFPAGSHRHAVRLARSDWERAARVRYARLATSSSRRSSFVAEWGWS